MREKVLELLDGLRPDVEFEKETRLMDDGILDSFDIISIVQEFDESFMIRIDVNDLGPENFNSVDAMIELITRLQAADL